MKLMLIALLAGASLFGETLYKPYPLQDEFFSVNTASQKSFRVAFLPDPTQPALLFKNGVKQRVQTDFYTTADDRQRFYFRATAVGDKVEIIYARPPIAVDVPTVSYVVPQDASREIVIGVRPIWSDDGKGYNVPMQTNGVWTTPGVTFDRVAVYRNGARTEVAFTSKLDQLRFLPADGQRWPDTDTVLVDYLAILPGGMGPGGIQLSDLGGVLQIEEHAPAPPTFYFRGTTGAMIGPFTFTGPGPYPVGGQPMRVAIQPFPRPVTQ